MATSTLFSSSSWSLISSACRSCSNLSLCCSNVCCISGRHCLDSTSARKASYSILATITTDWLYGHQSKICRWTETRLRYSFFFVLIIHLIPLPYAKCILHFVLVTDGKYAVTPALAPMEQQTTDFVACIINRHWILLPLLNVQYKIY